MKRNVGLSTQKNQEAKITMKPQKELIGTPGKNKLMYDHRLDIELVSICGIYRFSQLLLKKVPSLSGNWKHKAYS